MRAAGVLERLRDRVVCLMATLGLRVWGLGVAAPRSHSIEPGQADSEQCAGELVLHRYLVLW
jgi:hypothetical protein